MSGKSILNVGLLALLVSIARTNASFAFPIEIQACVSGAACSNPSLVEEQPRFTAYQYLDSGVPKFLFQYPLGPGSNESTHQVVTPLSGSAWLSAQAVYDLTQERHHFTLYLDGVAPTPTNLWIGDSNGLDVGLSLTTTDLLAGSGFSGWIMLT